MNFLDDVKLVARAASGRPLVEERTDATWSKPGTQTVNGHRRAGHWSHWSHRRRAGATWSTVAAFGLFGWLAWTDAMSAATAGLWFVRLTLVGLAWAWVEWARKYAHRRTTLRPLGERLATELDHAPYVLDPRSWLDVPVDCQDRPSVIYLPPGRAFTEAQEKKLVRLIATSIGLVSPSWTFDHRGERPHVEVRPAPAPRDAVTFTDADVRAHLDARPEGHLLLGLGPRDVPVWVDLEAESPHIGLSMATGAGKSVASRALAMQVLQQGGIVLVLDRKIESQLWALGHPGVRYACSEQEIYDALMDASDEVDRRFALVRERRFAGEVIDRAEIGPRLLVLAEEINALEIDLRIWWRSIRVTGDPAQCPALPVLGRLLAMGRAGRTHLDVVAQMLTCQAIGGPAARENLSTRVLGRATTRAWNMLAPECKTGGKFPRSSRHRGRVHVVVGDEATPCQVVFTSDEDALAYAMSGTVTTFPFTREVGATTAIPTGQDGGEVPHLARVLSLPVAIDEPADEPLLTLAEYAQRHGLEVKSLQNARDRGRLADPVEAGSGRPSRYRENDLDAWREQRAAGVGGGPA